MKTAKIATLAACLAVFAAPRGADAQNVALGKSVGASAGVNNSSGDPNRITNGVLNPDGMYWQSNSMWWSGTQDVTVYLGGSYTISAFTLQADNNDQYAVDYSNDGGASWFSAWLAGPQYNGGGVTTMNTTLASSITADQLRITGVGGDGLYSVSQIEATGSAVVATPEPATIGLLALGLAGLVPAVRRRR